MKELKIKNREKREMEGLKIITHCIYSLYSFAMPEIWVPVASREVPVASRRVGVASKGVGVASQEVPMGSDTCDRNAGKPSGAQDTTTAEGNELTMGSDKHTMLTRIAQRRNAGRRLSTVRFKRSVS